MTIKAVFWDLNGVFIKSPYLSKRFNEDFKIDIEPFVAALNSVMNQARVSKKPVCYSLFEPYLKEWNVPLKTSKDFFDYWFNAEKEDIEMVELARELKRKNIVQFVTSNNFIERTDFYARTFPFMKELFQKNYYSFEVGFQKPQPEFYDYVIKDSGFKAQEILYFDDSSKNVAQFAKMGGHSAVFLNKSQVLEKLKALRI